MRLHTLTLLALLYSVFCVCAQPTEVVTITTTILPTTDAATTSTPSTSASAQTTIATAVLGTPLSPSLGSSSSTAAIHAAAATTSASASSNGNYVDTDAGASGSGSSFSLSNGGLIAVIVVVVLVSVFGIASITLYILAKRRQWNIRASISRASRRLTGRSKSTDAQTDQKRARRTGLYTGGARKVPLAGISAVKPPGHKRGLVVEIKDVEKGSVQQQKKPWMKKLWDDDWK